MKSATRRVSAALAASLLLAGCGAAPEEEEEEVSPAAPPQAAPYVASPQAAPYSMAPAQDAATYAAAQPDASFGAAAPVPAATAGGEARLVQPHARGVFFDRRPLDAQVQRVAQDSRPSPDRLQRVQILDPSGFAQPLPAMTLEVPAGWVARGGVEWNRQVECVGNTWSLRWSASSPDGLHEVSLLPRLTWQVDSSSVVPMNPCPAAPMAGVRAYLEYLLRNARPQARVLSYRERPDLAARLAQGAQGNVRVEAADLLAGYSLGGQEMREMFSAAVTLSEMQGNIVASAETGLALRAPDGLLDFALFERIRGSARMDENWAQQMLAWSRQWVEMVSQRQVSSIQAWHQRRMNEITTAGMLERARIRQETLADIGRINSQIAASSSATSTRMHENFKDYIQEVQPWRDPGSGRQVDLSIHYQHAWQLDDGRQFLTNDPNFDPNRDLGIAGRALQPVR